MSCIITKNWGLCAYKGRQKLSTPACAFHAKEVVNPVLLCFYNICKLVLIMTFLTQGFDKGLNQYMEDIFYCNPKFLQAAQNPEHYLSQSCSIASWLLKFFNLSKGMRDGVVVLDCHAGPSIYMVQSLQQQKSLRYNRSCFNLQQQMAGRGTLACKPLAGPADMLHPGLRTLPAQTEAVWLCVTHQAADGHFW